jgi:hypothetical protein
MKKRSKDSTNSKSKVTFRPFALPAMSALSPRARVKQALIESIPPEFADLDKNGVEALLRVRKAAEELLTIVIEGGREHGLSEAYRESVLKEGDTQLFAAAPALVIEKHAPLRRWLYGDALAKWLDDLPGSAGKMDAYLERGTA